MQRGSEEMQLCRQYEPIDFIIQAMYVITKGDTHGTGTCNAEN